MTRRISEPDLQLILKTGETFTIEFKGRIPTPDILARNISAFANSEGGTLLIGVRDDGTTVGTKTEKVQKLLEAAQRRLSPPVKTYLYELHVDGKTIVAVDVEPIGNEPVLADGSALMRVGSTIQPVTSSQLFSLLKIPPDASALELSDQITRLTKIIEHQNETVENLRKAWASAISWKSKIQNWIIGGLIGAIIAIIVGAMLGKY